MGEMLEPRQTEEAAGSLDRVDEPKDLCDRAFVRRLALERHEEIAGGLDMFVRLDQEIVEEFVHEPA